MFFINFETGGSSKGHWYTFSLHRSTELITFCYQYYTNDSDIIQALGPGNVFMIHEEDIVKNTLLVELP